MALSTTAKNTVLTSLVGSSKAAGAPGTLYLALYDGNPTTTGAELGTSGGYARLAVTSNDTNFGEATAGEKANLTTFTFPTSTAAYSAPATYVVIFDASSEGNAYWYGALSATVTVDAAGYNVIFSVGDFTLVM